MSVQDHRSALCSLGLFLALATFPQTAMAGDDSGVPDGSGVIMGDTTPFAPTEMPPSSNRQHFPSNSAPLSPDQGQSGDVVMGEPTPFAPTQLPTRSPEPEFPSSPPPFSADPGVIPSTAASFLPPPASSNPNRIRINHGLIPPPQDSASPMSPQSAPTARDPSQFPDQLNVQDARQYLLSLINRDRQAQGLRSVFLDEVATKGGQVHTDEMVQNCFHGHWGMDGKKPDQRYTEAGGKDMVAENAWFTCGSQPAQHVVPLEPQPYFDKRQIDQIESSFINEVPPNDGHRKNILKPFHTSVGIALSKASEGEEWPRVACTEEFTNKYGDYAPIPPSTTPDSRFNVAGKLYPGIELYSLDVMTEPLPKPMTVEELNNTGGYNNPSERIATYWPQPAGDKTISVRNNGSGQEFFVQVRVKARGLYYIWIWAKAHGMDKPFIVSDRTVVVR